MCVKWELNYNMPTLWKKIMKRIDINEYNDWLEKKKNFDKFDRFKSYNNKGID